MLSVFSFGEVLVDLLPGEAGCFIPLAGGAPANVAVAVAKLGGEGYFVGGLSQDNMGEFLRSELCKHSVNIDFCAIKTNKTALVLVTLDNDGERSFEFYRDDTADLTFNQNDLSQVDWQNVNIFHFCSNTFTPTPLADVSFLALEQAKAHDILVSFDVNLRLNLWPEEQGVEQKILSYVEKALQFSDVVKVSSEELEWLAVQSCCTPSEYSEKVFASGVSLLLITDGAKAITVLHRNWQLQVTPPATDVVDTTGAGDSFIGGFLHQMSLAKDITQLRDELSNQQAIKQKIEFAAKCGAFTVRQKGAFAAMPCIDQI